MIVLLSMFIMFTIKNDELAGYVARILKNEIYEIFWYESLKKRRHIDDTCVDGRIILKWNSNT